ncbi:kinase-like domain-containing protein [Cokeromyces recurvatus]|uniref:kinase-like domain-containing protein n=1 Tax=Cokeromyces recurvatus TaxID=90255 RepID=UPI00221F6FEA|nr:kinase-like domain-containing protein [Cokeromyces recurvatus]KAI7906267.1 kinase-like domain-containing protein [Cokeromyces recurvatus]
MPLNHYPSLSLSLFFFVFLLFFLLILNAIWIMKDLLNFPSLSSFTITSANKQPSFLKQPKRPTFVQSIKCLFSNKDSLKPLCYYGQMTNVQIGTGAFATVHLITDSKERYYASSSTKTIMNEFCIASSLDHLNIIKTYDLVLLNKKYYCSIMEYCPGGDLYTFLKQDKMKTLTMKQVNEYLQQILKGLNYLHTNGIAHRDIKLENILLVPLNDDDDKVLLKITDFGEAQWGNESVGIHGTTPYMAPEVFDKNHSYGAMAADVWSVGVIYFSMRLEGFPFITAEMSDSNYRLYLQRYKWRSYPVFRKLDKQSQILLYGMLNPNSQNRFTVETILNFSWMKEETQP